MPKFKGTDGHEIAALYVFLKVAHELVYTTAHLDKELNKLNSLFESHPEIDLIKKHSEKTSKIMIAWLKYDNYNETRNMGDYQLLNKEDSWIPTRPDYMDALEPHWGKIKSITLDSASQFAPLPPTK
jgi:hypothetical protein